MTRAFVFDVDGVLIRGKRALPGARAALERLTARGVPWLVLTNGGGLPEAARAAALGAELGVEIRPEQYVQSHTPFRDFVGRTDRVLVVGGADGAARTAAEAYGFKDVVIPGDIVAADPATVAFPAAPAALSGARPLQDFAKPFDAAFVFHDSRDATTDTQLLIDLLLSDGGRLGTRRPEAAHSGRPAVPVYFSNGDMQWATDYAVPRLGQGAFEAMVAGVYRQLAGHELERTVIGKPTALTYEFATRALRAWARTVTGADRLDRVYMIGDNQHSDILGANRAGWASVLVRTGVYRDGDELFTDPTHIVDDVTQAIDVALADE